MTTTEGRISRKTEGVLNTETVIEFDFAPGDGQDFHAAKLMVSGHIDFHILTCGVATRSLGGFKVPVH